MSLHLADLSHLAGGDIPAVEISSAAGKDDFLSAGVEESGSADGGVLDLDRGQSWIWSRICIRSDMMKVNDGSLRPWIFKFTTRIRSEVWNLLPVDFGFCGPYWRRYCWRSV